MIPIRHLSVSNALFKLWQTKSKLFYNTKKEEKRKSGSHFYFMQNFSFLEHRVYPLCYHKSSCLYITAHRPKLRYIFSLND